MVSFLWGGGRDTSHIDYINQTCRRLKTTRQIFNCVRWYLSCTDGISPMGDAAPSHIDYIRQTSRRLNTTRQIHQFTASTPAAHPSTPTLPPSLICGSARSWSEGQLDVGERGILWSGACYLRLLSPKESSDTIKKDNIIYCSYKEGT